MLECGLGAFHLALLHWWRTPSIRLTRFSRPGVPFSPSQKARLRSIHPATILLSILAASGISFSTVAALGGAPLDQLALNGIFSLALAQMLWGLWSTGHRVWQVPLGLAFSAMFSVAYIVLDRAAESS